MLSADLSPPTYWFLAGQVTDAAPILLLIVLLCNEGNEHYINEERNDS